MRRRRLQARVDPRSSSCSLNAGGGGSLNGGVVWPNVWDLSMESVPMGLERMMVHIPATLAGLYVGLCWLGAALGTSPSRTPTTVLLAPVMTLLMHWSYGWGVLTAWWRIHISKNAGLQMLPVIDGGTKRTVLHIFLHALILIPISTLPFFFGVSGRVYFVGAYILSNIYMLLCLPFILEQNKDNARLIFKTSIYYFPLLLSLIVADLRV